MNKLTLKYELDIDFSLIAITCPLKDYRLCYYVNKATGLDLHKIEDHEILLESRKSIYFGRYLFENTNDHTVYYLLNNKGVEGGILIPEMRGTDFFLLVRNAIDEELLAWQINQISQIQEVLVAKEIDPYKLKSRENLIF